MKHQWTIRHLLFQQMIYPICFQSLHFLRTIRLREKSLGRREIVHGLLVEDQEGGKKLGERKVNSNKRKSEVFKT